MTMAAYVACGSARPADRDVRDSTLLGTGALLLT